MPPDSTDTRRRLLEAAEAEFARHGLGGARIDRIAEAAGANKRLLYVYYGNKEQLFDTVLTAAVSRLADAVPLDPDNLPAYVGGIFDYLVKHPEMFRLTTWRSLERPEHAEPDMASYQRKVGAMRTARQQGRLPEAFDPADLLAIVVALAKTWFLTSPALLTLSADDPWSAERLATHRAALVEAVTRLVSGERAYDNAPHS
ncbi:MAG TPA: TetR family transcriptional regulator [Pseudonocardia sp.]|jgi:AcrR family transcriptional regulator